MTATANLGTYQDWLRQSRDRAFVENRYDER